MIFTSPIWLLGLLPLAGVAIYLLTGRRRNVSVSFLGLWKDAASLPQPRAAVHRSPWFVILMLITTLLSVVAAAGPMLRTGGKASLVTVILDRGTTMSPSARGEQFR